MRSTHLPVALRLFVVAGAGIALAACDISIEAGNQVTAREAKHFNVTGTPELVLTTFDGAVEVRAWDRPEISVEIEKHAASQADADALQVKAEQTGNRVSIEAVKPQNHRVTIGFSMSPSVKLIASVPRQCNLSAKSGDGSITIERVAGNLALDTGDGSIRVDDVEGKVRAHTGDGSLKLDRVTGAIDIDTGDGSVTARGKLQAVRIRTSDGSVRLGLTQGSAMAEDWEIRTGDGGVTMEVPDGFGADLDASTGDGSVTVHDVNVEGETSRHAVRGKIAAGGRLLRVRTGDGSIVIQKG